MARPLPLEMRMPTETLIWEPMPRQHAFLSCPTEDVLFGGARGGGKTDGLLGDWLAHSYTYGPHARGILLRRTYPELEEVERRAHELYPPLGARWLAVKRTWRMPDGGLLRLRHLHRDLDATNYQGHSYTWVGVDEMGMFPRPAPIDTLRATLRSAAGVPCYFRGTANPGGVGHNWIKRRYIEPMPPMTEHYDAAHTTYRLYIPSTLDDNPILQREDPEYWRRVEAAAGGRQDLLKAWRYGDWDIVAGGMFDDVWLASVHVLDPFPIPSGWYLDRAHDWGSSKPYCTLWFAESNGDAVRLADGSTRSFPRGTVFVVAEDYGWNGKPNEGLRLTATAIAQRAKAAEQRLGYRVHPGPGDDPLWEVRNGVSMADDMAQVGIVWDRPSKGPGSRVAGWGKIRELLQAATQQPMEAPGLFVFASCRNLIRLRHGRRRSCRRCAAAPGAGPETPGPPRPPGSLSHAGHHHAPHLRRHARHLADAARRVRRGYRD
jgi:hypothetical protein